MNNHFHSVKLTANAPENMQTAQKGNLIFQPSIFGSVQVQRDPSMRTYQKQLNSWYQKKTWKPLSDVVVDMKVQWDKHQGAMSVPWTAFRMPSKSTTISPIPQDQHLLTG